MRDDDDPLLSLGDLLFVLHMRPGVLATAIEEHGIYTWDRFGRFAHYRPGSPEVSRALDHLAAVHTAETDPEQREFFDRELFSDAGGDAFCWPSSHAPDFDAIEARTQQPQAPKPVNTAGATKTANAHAGIIRGLLRFIKGEFDGVRRHPDFVSEADLRDVLEKQMLGFPGCSAENTKRKFKIANDLIPKHELEGP
jgi:hypothetical protein